MPFGVPGTCLSQQSYCMIQVPKLRISCTTCHFFKCVKLAGVAAGAL